VVGDGDFDLPALAGSATHQSEVALAHCARGERRPELDVRRAVAGCDDGARGLDVEPVGEAALAGIRARFQAFRVAGQQCVGERASLVLLERMDGRAGGLVQDHERRVLAKHAQRQLGLGVGDRVARDLGGDLAAGQDRVGLARPPAVHPHLAGGESVLEPGPRDVQRLGQIPVKPSRGDLGRHPMRDLQALTSLRLSAAERAAVELDSRVGRSSTLGALAS